MEITSREKSYLFSDGRFVLYPSSDNEACQLGLDLTSNAV